MGAIEALEDRLQAAASDEAAWPMLLMGLADVLGAEEATLGGGLAGDLQMVAPRTDPGRIGTYFETYHQHNAIMQRMMRQPVGGVVVIDGFAEFEPFQRSDFYNQWCVPQGFNHALGFTLATAIGWRGALVVNRRHTIENDQAALLQQLAPRLARTLETSQLVAQVRGAHRAGLDALAQSGKAAVLLNRHGDIIEANAPAHAMMETGELWVRERRIRSVTPDGERALARAIAACSGGADGGSRTIALAGGNGALRLLVAPFPGSVALPALQRPAAIVMIDNPGRTVRERLEALRRDHGLTPAEAELALAIVEAGSRKAAAARRNVSDATARAQLSSIFDKTGVRRQTELVRLLLLGP
jgi:DNA-binding CsgD family transcriptional regulator